MLAREDATLTRSNDNAERRSPPSDPPPSAFGRYEVLFPIDRGGMAEVLACRIRGEGHFERYFAVKRMAKEMIRHEKFVQSFLDEARLTGSIHSPNVVQVVDLGRDDRGAPFLVMELVKGVSLSTLRKRLGAELLPLGAVVEIGSQAASGLEDAHTATDVRGESLGIVHRDISPQNILLGIDGRVRIADFGIARAKQRLAQTTQSGELKGKFAYFAPEQLRSESDPRTDVFALGVVLWELIAGRALFYKPEVLETIMNVERMPIPRLDTIRQDVPEALASLIARVLERDLEARCPSAGVLSNELRELLDRGVVAQTPQAELRKIAYRGAESLLQRLQEAAGPAPDAGRESLGESFVSTSTGTGPERLEPASVQPVTVQGPRPKAIERTTVRDLSNEIAGEVSTRVVVAAPSLVHASDAAEAAPAITVPGRVEVTDDLGTTWKTPGPQPHLDDGAREDAAIVAELEDASAIRTARGVDPRRENARDTARDLDPVPPISTLQPPVRVSAPIEARVVPVLSAPDTPARRPAMLWVAGATLGLLGVAAVVAIAPWSSSLRPRLRFRARRPRSPRPRLVLSPRSQRRFARSLRRQCRRPRRSRRRSKPRPHSRRTPRGRRLTCTRRARPVVDRRRARRAARAPPWRARARPFRRARRSPPRPP